MRGIKKFDDPILSQACRMVLEFDDALEIDADLTDTLRARIDAVGLAAPQIGEALCAIAIKPHQSAPIVVLFNPKIVEQRGGFEESEEGCLSYPGVFVQVRRAREIVVEYDHLADHVQDTRKWAQRRIRIFKGFESRIVQHEVDHCNGVCLVGDAWRRGCA